MCEISIQYKEMPEDHKEYGYSPDYIKSDTAFILTCTLRSNART